jgi:hypothetical protein
MSIALMIEDIQYGMKSLGIGSSQCVYEECDAEGWNFLTETAVSLAQKYDDLKEVYVQEASLRESQIENYQARNVGRLTSLATILVPFSVSAGMFSMGGEYLAGEKNFWVFWAVAIPMVWIFGLLIFTQILQRLEEVWKGRLRRSVSIPSGSVRSFWKRGLASPKKAFV